MHTAPVFLGLGVGGGGAVRFTFQSCSYRLLNCLPLTSAHPGAVQILAQHYSIHQTECSIILACQLGNMSHREKQLSVFAFPIASG